MRRSGLKSGRHAQSAQPRKIYSLNLARSAIVCCGLLGGMAAVAQETAVAAKSSRAIEGNVDARTYNINRRYRASFRRCHGPDGVGATFAPSLIDPLLDIEAFRSTVREGTRNGSLVMKGFAND